MRENVVNSLRSLLHENVYAAAIEGPEGVGKTTVLAQFARANPAAAVSTFVSAANRLSFDADLIRMDIANQVYFAVTGDILQPQKYEPALLKSNYSDLQRLAKRKKLIVYFILDGLEELDVATRQLLLQQLADILPIGVQQFRFLFSGDETLYAPLFGRKLPIKSFPLTEISLEESKLLFAAHDLSAEELRELYVLCGGIPGRLSSILRAAQAGLSIPAFLKDPPGHKPDFFQIEWSQVPDSDDVLRRILALLVHDARPHTIADVGETLRIPFDLAKSKIETVTFLTIDPSNSQIHVANAALRRFIAERLADRKPGIQKLLIKRLLQSPESDDAVLHLPEYLEDAAQFHDLLTLLTPDHILQVLERSQTLSRVEDTVHRGFRSAERLGRDPDLLRFGIQQSVIGELAASNVWESEVGALSSLGRDAEALALANNAVLKEDRLQLLAALAHGTWLRGRAVSPELLDQIRLLIENLDSRALGRRAQRIASQLTCVSPDLAMVLLRKTKPSSADDNDLDRAFAHLTITALNDLKDERRRAEALDTVTVSRQDPRARSVLQGVRVLSSRLTAADVCARVDQIEDPDAKIKVLRYWCMLNGNRPDADLVAHHALTTALGAIAATLDSSLLADLSMALGGTGDPERKKTLIAALDGVRGTAERLGPSVDYVRLQLSIARAEFTVNPAAAAGRLMELIDYAVRIADSPSRGEACAHFLATLKVLDARNCLISGDSLERQCADELETVVLQLAVSTADHYLALNGIITALANGYLEKALEYIRIVNTELRRDAILVQVIEASVNRPTAEVSPEDLRKVLGEIRRSDDRDRATQAIMERFADATDLPDRLVDGLLPLISSLPDLDDSVRACRSMVCAANMLYRHPTKERDALREDIRGQIHERWAQIDVAWSRIDTGFGISKDLAITSPDDAVRMLLATETLKNESRIAAQRPAAAYVACIGLAIRALCGLVPKKLETDSDLQALSALIDILPSYGERAVLWADMCMRCSLAGRVDLTERLVKEFLEPALNHIPEGDRAYRTRVLVQVAPALFRVHQATCLEMLAVLDPDDRDLALRGIARFMLQSRVPSDPVEATDGLDGEVSWDILRNVTELIEAMETDWMIYATAKDIAEVLRSAKNRYTVNTPQREDIAGRIELIANRKLPTKRQIGHIGYRIVTLANAIQIRKGKPAEWEGLVASARSLENIADRALVLQIVALCLPSNMAALRSKLLAEARVAIESIPSDLDRFEHYLGLSDDLRGTDSVQCRELVNAAASVLAKSSEDVREHQKRLVDLAYRIDEALAKNLIDHFDDDEAKRSAQRQMELLEVRRNLGTDENATKALHQIRPRDLSKLGWSLVRALNAGRFQTFHPSRIRPYLEAATVQPLHQSYSILLWYIENAVVRFARTDQAATFLRPMLDATIVGAELAGQVAGKGLIRLRALKQRSMQVSPGHSLLVSPGTRDEAVQILSGWFEKQLGQFVRISDPYFGPDDLNWLQIIRAAKPGCSICVMAARKNQPKPPEGRDLEDVYADGWRRLCDQKPPDTEIAIIGGERTKDSPIHDRWILSDGVGLRLGTSLNSLGISKDSEISEMSAEDAAQKLAEIDQYLNREKTEHQGEKLRITRFGL
jgi:hypothetical protein